MILLLLKLSKNYISARAELASAREALTGDDGLVNQENDILRKLEKSNINVDRFKKFLAAAPQRRAEEIKALKESHTQQSMLITDIETAYDAYAGIAGRLDDPEDLKRMLRGSGVLEFRILPSPSQEDLTGRVSDYINKLAEFGPVKASTDDYVWRKIRDPKTFRMQGAIVGNYVEDYYVLASNKKTEKLTGSGENTWKLKSARPDQDQYGSPAVSFCIQ